MSKKYYKYDKSNNPIFLKNDNGDEIYAKNEKTGDEIYPSRGNPFAINRFGLEYYAKSANGDEKYAIRNNKCVPIYRSRMRDVLVIAQTTSGKQIYPSTKSGDEYYFLDKENDNQPFLMRDENGNEYFAQTRNGIKIIPHKYFINEYEKIATTRYFLNVDAARNVVYSEGDKIYQSNLCECICSIIITIPYTVCDIIPLLSFCCIK